MNTPFELQTGQAVGITRHVLNQVIALQDGAVALLFCYLLSHPEPLDFSQAEFTLALSEKEAKRAFVVLRDAGLVAAAPAGMPVLTAAPTLQITQAPPAPEPLLRPTAPVYAPTPPLTAIPSPASSVISPVMPTAVVTPPRGLEVGERGTYSSRQITDMMQQNSDFRDVVREAETRLNKVLSPSDLQLLYSMYDWRGLPPGVLSLLITHCVEEAREKYGPGRPPTMKQIDKEAANWEREGVDTEARAEAHLSELADRRMLRGDILSVLQIRGRAPSTTEERYIKEWVKYNYSVELISLAYDKTVVRTGGMNWKYMDTILKNWREKNLTTPAEVESSDTRPPYGAPSSQPKRTRQAPPPQSDIPAGEHERAAVEDMRDFLRRLRNESE